MIIYLYIYFKEDWGWKEFNLLWDNYLWLISFLFMVRFLCRVWVFGCIFIYICVNIYIFLYFYFLSVLWDKDIELLVFNGSFYKIVFMFGCKRGFLFIYYLRYKCIILFVLIFIFKMIWFIYFFLDLNMKSFWFNEDEIYWRRNCLRWFRFYWLWCLDIDYCGVIRLLLMRS